MERAGDLIAVRAGGDDSGRVVRLEGLQQFLQEQGWSWAMSVASGRWG